MKFQIPFSTSSGREETVTITPSSRPDALYTVQSSRNDFAVSTREVQETFDAAVDLLLDEVDDLLYGNELWVSVEVYGNQYTFFFDEDTRSVVGIVKARGIVYFYSDPTTVARKAVELLLGDEAL